MIKQHFPWKKKQILLIIIFILNINFSMSDSLKYGTGKSKRHMYNTKLKAADDVIHMNSLYGMKSTDKLSKLKARLPRLQTETNRFSYNDIADRLKPTRTNYLSLNGLQRKKPKHSILLIKKVYLGDSKEADGINVKPSRKITLKDKIFLVGNNKKTKNSPKSKPINVNINHHKKSGSINRWNNYPQLHYDKSMLKTNQIPERKYTDNMKYNYLGNVKKNPKTNIISHDAKAKYTNKSPLELKKRFIESNVLSSADPNGTEIKNKRTGLVINHPLVELNIYGNKPIEKGTTELPLINKSSTIRSETESFNDTASEEPSSSNSETERNNENTTEDAVQNSESGETSSLSGTTTILEAVETTTIFEVERKNFSVTPKEIEQIDSQHSNTQEPNSSPEKDAKLKDDAIDEDKITSLKSNLLKEINRQELEQNKNLVTNELVNLLLGEIVKNNLTTITNNLNSTKNLNSSLAETKKQFPAYVRSTNEAEFATEFVYNEDITDNAASLFGDDFEDATITFGARCDYRDRNICWFDREIGDSLTLSVNISSIQKADAFRMRWRRIYSKKDAKSSLNVELKQERSPWNMVFGNNGRELRLNPITDSDMDPNAFVVKIFGQANRRGMKVYQLLKQLTYRISILPIDMGPVYSGEELNINIENFISLPEKGDLTFNWAVERSREICDPLPSNMKVSQSGRTVVVKELKKERNGPLVCVIYSSNGIAVAKRRFRIQNAMDVMTKRSAQETLTKKRHLPNPYKIHKTNKRCPPSLRYHSTAEPKTLQKSSRRKRYRRSYEDMLEKLDKYDALLKGCGRKTNSDGMQTGRGARSIVLFGLANDNLSETPDDSRLTPLDRLIEESQKGDGTLDDVIPREVHYILPGISLVTDDPPNIVERSDDRLFFLANCTSDLDCGPQAFCVIPKGREVVVHQQEETHLGYCYCRPEFFGDGFRCYRIQIENHREKRIRRETVDDFELAADSSVKTDIANITATGLDDLSGFPVENSGSRPSVTETVIPYEVEDAYLVSSCLNTMDCSSHANCESSLLDNGHMFCRCRTGYHGNGLFCWEIVA